MINATNAKAPSQAERAKSFTSEKLDIVDALNVDPHIKPSAFKVAFCILQHVNAKTGRASVSDETIRDKTNIGVRSVKRLRRELRDTGWLEWRRTRTVNSYRFKLTNINRSLDLLTQRRDARIERWRSGLVSPESCPVSMEVMPMTLTEGTSDSLTEMTQESPIHFRSTPTVITLKNRSAGKTEIVAGRGRFQIV